MARRRRGRGPSPHRAAGPTTEVRGALAAAGLEPLALERVDGHELGFWVAGRGERFWVSVVADRPATDVNRRFERSQRTRADGRPLLLDEGRYPPTKWGQTARWTDPATGRMESFTPARYAGATVQTRWEAEVDELTDEEVRALLAGMGEE